MLEVKTFSFFIRGHYFLGQKWKNQRQIFGAGIVLGVSSQRHFMITYISMTVGDMKTKLFLLKTNVLKFTQQNLNAKI